MFKTKKSLNEKANKELEKARKHADKAECLFDKGKTRNGQKELKKSLRHALKVNDYITKMASI